MQLFCILKPEADLLSKRSSRRTEVESRELPTNRSRVKPETLNPTPSPFLLSRLWGSVPMVAWGPLGPIITQATIGTRTPQPGPPRRLSEPRTRGSGTTIGTPNPGVPGRLSEPHTPGFRDDYRNHTPHRPESSPTNRSRVRRAPDEQK